MFEKFNALAGLFKDEESFHIFLDSIYFNAEFASRKNTICAAMENNQCGFAEKITEEVEKKKLHDLANAEETIKVLRKQVVELQARLERELDWQKYRPDGITTEQYKALVVSGRAKQVCAPVAKCILNSQFGFDTDDVEILNCLPVLEINRAGETRVVGKTERRPLYMETGCGTGWYYIAFRMGKCTYETTQDGTLRRVFRNREGGVR